MFPGNTNSPNNINTMSPDQQKLLMTIANNASVNAMNRPTAFSPVTSLMSSMMMKQTADQNPGITPQQKARLFDQARIDFQDLYDDTDIPEDEKYLKGAKILDSVYEIGNKLGIPKNDASFSRLENAFKDTFMKPTDIKKKKAKDEEDLQKEALKKEDKTVDDINKNAMDQERESNYTTIYKNIKLKLDSKQPVDVESTIDNYVMHNIISIDQGVKLKNIFNKENKSADVDYSSMGLPPKVVEAIGSIRQKLIDQKYSPEKADLIISKKLKEKGLLK